MDILVKTTKKATLLLNAVRAEYRITLPTGEVFTNIVAPAKNGKKAPVKAKAAPAKKSLYRYAGSYLNNAKPGDVVVIPSDGSPLDKVQRNAAAWAFYHWGRNAHTTCYNHSSKSIEVLRVK